ncbi:MAG TPA: dienelactone hydrolase family protein [Pseudonocardiaceae bacterium]
MARLGPLLADPERMQTIGRAALDVLLAEPRADATQLAAVGYGAGGTIALELARDGVDLKAVIGVNPGLATMRPEDSVNITGQVLVCVGSEDPIVPPEQRRAFQEEMQAAGVDWRLNIYGGAEHAFHHPPVNPDGSPSDADTHKQSVLPGVSYHHAHAQRVWRHILDLLDETFRLPSVHIHRQLRATPEATFDAWLDPGCSASSRWC